MNEHLQEAYKKYKSHIYSASQRTIPFKLTFEQWYNIWQESGKWDHRGRGSGKYVMSRKNDKGAYEIGNVFIQSNARNVSDGRKGIRLPNQIEKLAEINKGKKQSSEHIRKRIESRIKTVYKNKQGIIHEQI